MTNLRTSSSLLKLKNRRILVALKTMSVSLTYVHDRVGEV